MVVVIVVVVIVGTRLEGLGKAEAEKRATAAVRRRGVCIKNCHKVWIARCAWVRVHVRARVRACP